MISKQPHYTIAHFLQFSPFILFLITYSFLYLYNLHTKNLVQHSVACLAGIPLTAAFITILYSFFTYKENINFRKKIELFFTGIMDFSIIYNYFLLLSLSIFNHMMAKTNGILTAITLISLYIPASWMTVFFFLLACFLSIIIQSLSIAIILSMPIAYGVAQTFHICPELMAATIIGGALCGNHLALLWKKISQISDFIKKSDTIILPTIIITLYLLSQTQYEQLHPVLHEQLLKSFQNNQYISLFPYLFFLILGFSKIDLLANIILASCTALSITIFYHQTLFLPAITDMFIGSSQKNIIFYILFLHLILAGLMKVIKYNGGFIYLVEKFKKKSNNHTIKSSCTILFLSMIKNMLTIIDIPFFTTMPLSIKKLINQYKLSYHTMLTLSNMVTTTVQSALPYSAAMLWVIATTQCSYILIIEYMIYPILLMISIIIFILSSSTLAQHKNL